MSDMEKLRDAVIAAGLADLEACEALHMLGLEPTPRDIALALRLDMRRNLARAELLATSIAHVGAMRALRAANDARTSVPL